MIDLNRIARAVLMVPAVFIIGIVRVIRPLFLVRFGALVSGRIGHLAGNTEIYLCEREAGLHPKGLLGGLDLWTHIGTPCNRQLAKMISRSLHVDPSGFVRLLLVANHCFAGWERHVAQSEQHDRDIHNLMEKQRSHLRFTGRELEAGRDAVRRMGIPDGAKWICLIVRDAAYLNHPAFAYHRHRDTKIGTYRKAAVALAERGYYVIRMGAAVEERFGVDGPHVIDYATNGMRSDFMDIYLGAHCAFAISTGTGLDAVPAISRKPICFVNYVPFEYMNTWIDGLVIWQHHFRRGKEMTPTQIIESGAGLFMRAEEFQRARIRLRFNTPEEIEEVCLQMATRCEMKQYNDFGEPSQEHFWECFPTGTISVYNGKPLHGEVRLRIGCEFLRSYDKVAA